MDDPLGIFKNEEIRKSEKVFKVRDYTNCSLKLRKFCENHLL